MALETHRLPQAPQSRGKSHKTSHLRSEAASAAALETPSSNSKWHKISNLLYVAMMGAALALTAPAALAQHGGDAAGGFGGFGGGGHIGGGGHFGGGHFGGGHFGGGGMHLGGGHYRAAGARGFFSGRSSAPLYGFGVHGYKAPSNAMIRAYSGPRATHPAAGEKFSGPVRRGAMRGGPVRSGLGLRGQGFSGPARWGGPSSDVRSLLGLRGAGTSAFSGHRAPAAPIHSIIGFAPSNHIEWQSRPRGGASFAGGNSSAAGGESIVGAAAAAGGMVPGRAGRAPLSFNGQGHEIWQVASPAQTAAVRTGGVAARPLAPVATGARSALLSGARRLPASGLRSQITPPAPPHIISPPRPVRQPILGGMGSPYPPYSPYGPPPGLIYGPGMLGFGGYPGYGYGGGYGNGFGGCGGWGGMGGWGGGWNGGGCGFGYPGFFDFGGYDDGMDLNVGPDIGPGDDQGYDQSYDQSGTQDSGTDQSIQVFSGEQNDNSNLSYDTGEAGPMPPAGANAAVAPSGPPTLLFLTDGTNFTVTDYWLAGGQLHYLTTYGGANTISLEQLDWQRTVDENAARGVAFSLRPAANYLPDSSAPPAAPQNPESPSTEPR